MTTDTAQPAAPTITQKYYRAFFTPQVWVRDYALDTDAEGEQEWTVSDEHVADAARILADDPDFGLDRDDVLKGDPAAPEWVREYTGPFTISVTEATEHTEDEVRGDICSDLRAAGHADAADEAGGMTVGDALAYFEQETGRGWSYSSN